VSPPSQHLFECVATRGGHPWVVVEVRGNGCASIRRATSAPSTARSASGCPSRHPFE